jgi:hypothetical protein
MNHMNCSAALAAISLLGFPTLTGCARATSDGEPTLGHDTQAISTDFCPADVPAALTPAPDQTLKMHFMGVGVQIYICNATATGFGWTFVAPQANLLRDDGSLVGTHFIGPTWQGNDGSFVKGTRVAGVTVDPTAIPWLLLTGAPSGDGRFADVTSIQRLSTVGGIAPATPCDATKLGTIAQVPYSADYVFYNTKDDGNVKQCGG